MSGYGYKEARISQERRPRVYYCGECGTEVRSNELLCDDCARSEVTRWELERPRSHVAFIARKVIAEQERKRK